MTEWQRNIIKENCEATIVRSRGSCQEKEGQRRWWNEDGGMKVLWEGRRIYDLVKWMFNRIQIIRRVTGNNNLIINGDVVANRQILPKLAAILSRSDIELLSQEAQQEMRNDISECVNKIAEQVVEKKLEERLTEFVRPSTQWAFYATLKGYTISETLEQREMLVDSMIDRLQLEWNSTERLIVDSALEILPSLTPATLSTLGLLQLRHQIIMAPIGAMIDHFLSSLTPLAEQMSGIGALETEYLKQEKLILPLPGFKTAIPFEQYLLKAYDLFFRKPLPAGVYEDYCKEHPEAREAVMDAPMATCMMWMDANNGVTGFCNSNSNNLKSSLIERHQDYIIPHVDVLMGMMTPFTEQEVKDYFVKFTPAWERLFNLFSSEVFTHYTLSITGNYIGGKILAKACHGNPMPLSDYSRETI